MDEYPEIDDELEFEARHRDELEQLNDFYAELDRDSRPRPISDSRTGTPNSKGLPSRQDQFPTTSPIIIPAAGAQAKPASIERPSATQHVRSIANSTRPTIDETSIQAGSSHLNLSSVKLPAVTRKRDHAPPVSEFDNIDDLDADLTDLFAEPEWLELRSPLSKRLRTDQSSNTQSPRRGRHCGPTSMTSAAAKHNVMDDRNKDCQRLLRRIPMGNYVSLTNLCGTRVYMRLRSKDADQKDIVGRTRRVQGLLQTSYDILRLEVEKERESRLKREIHAEFGDQPYSETLNSHREPDKLGSDLWVERFKPNNYLELLSDDGTNRNLLRWLKQWDKVVFGREVKLRSSVNKDHQPRTDDVNSAKNSQFKNNRFTKKISQMDRELDQWNRPSQKIALLSGPPGLGKTTLAHIIAKQAGYKAVEMNASDDRSVEAFKNQIEAATQMKSVMGQNPRPNCLIIDEIDGAPLTSINALISVIAAKPSNQDSASKKKRRKDQGLLQRPIICICNDQYAPALRPLRNLALLLHFPQTLSSRLAARLMEICHKEHLRADLSTLLALCESQTNDIRSCLSTLQFINNRKKELRMIDVCSMSVGQKDVQMSLFSVWQDIFRLPKQKRNYSLSQLPALAKEAKSTDGTSMSERFKNTLRVAQGFGDYEKVNLGMHDNYATVKYKDHDLSKASYGIDWLCINDLFNQEIQRSQNYSLMAYLPFASVAFHLLFASNPSTKIHYPSSHYDFVSKVTRSSNIIETLVSELQPSTRIYVNGSILVLDMLPLLLDIICPTMRQVNTQLYSATEKAQFQRLIDTMITFSLVYRQQLGDDGQYTYVLDHPIDLVASFTGSTMPSRNQLPYATKQLISREIEQEKLRKRDTMKAVASDSQPSTSRAADIAKPEPFKVLRPLHKISSKEKPMKDFFGRPIDRPKSTATPSTEHSSGKALIKSDIWFHFKEGYSNAVKKNVTMESLM